MPWYLVGYLREAWGKLGKNYLILERLVGETFWKNIYPSRATSTVEVISVNL